MALASFSGASSSGAAPANPARVARCHGSRSKQRRNRGRHRGRAARERAHGGSTLPGSFPAGSQQIVEHAKEGRCGRQVLASARAGPPPPWRLNPCLLGLILYRERASAGRDFASTHEPKIAAAAEVRHDPRGSAVAATRRERSSCRWPGPAVAIRTGRRVGVGGGVGAARPAPCSRPNRRRAGGRGFGRGAGRASIVRRSAATSVLMAAVPCSRRP